MSSRLSGSFEHAPSSKLNLQMNNCIYLFCVQTFNMHLQILQLNSCTHCNCVAFHQCVLTYVSLRLKKVCTNSCKLCTWINVSSELKQVCTNSYRWCTGMASQYCESSNAFLDFYYLKDYLNNCNIGIYVASQ